MLSALCGHLLCDISHRQMYEEVSYLNMLGLAGFQMGENFGYLNANAMDRATNVFKCCAEWAVLLMDSTVLVGVISSDREVLYFLDSNARSNTTHHSRIQDYRGLLTNLIERALVYNSHFNFKPHPTEDQFLIRVPVLCRVSSIGVYGNVHCNLW